MSALTPPYGFTFTSEPPPAHDPAGNALSGFWLFMMSDLVIFALVFATYVTMLMPLSFAHGPTPRQLFELPGAALETAVLLSSTFTFAMASLAIKYERGRRPVMFWLLLTLALGVSFLGLEVREFARMFAEGAVPQRSGFLSAFFGLVPLHGLHVLAGSIWLTLMLIQITRRGLTEAVRSRLARLALFWHFLDLIWVGIFSIVYLGGRA
jgi:cytochrome o ubiquinol oxidase subunit 3